MPRGERAEQMTSPVQRTCFIIHHPGADISPLVRALLKSHVRPTSSRDPHSKSLLTSVEDAIREADFVCLVLDDEQDVSANAAFELGVARGLDKPLLALSRNRGNAVSRMPDFVRRFNVVDYDALEFHLGAFLANAVPSRSHRKSKSGKSRSLKRHHWSLPPLSDVTEPERVLRTITTEAFKNEGALIWTEADADAGTDLAVWLDRLKGPLLVELKVSRGGRPEVFSAQLELQRRAMERAAVAALLIVWCEREPENLPEVASPYPVITTSAQALVTLANHRKLIPWVVDCRNAVVHSRE